MKEISDFFPTRLRLRSSLTPDGHRAAVTSAHFLSESTVLTMSRDATWKVWTLDVNMKIGATPEVIREGTMI